MSAGSSGNLKWKRFEARKEGDEKAVRLLLQNTEFSLEKIAELVGVSVALAKEVKEKQH